jgi:hypothetical protein
MTSSRCSTGTSSTTKPTSCALSGHWRPTSTPW